MDYFDEFLDSYFTKRMSDAIYGAGILWYGCIPSHTRDDIRKQGLSENELDYIEEWFQPRHRLKDSTYEPRGENWFSAEVLEEIGIAQKHRDDEAEFSTRIPTWEEFYGRDAE